MAPTNSTKQKCAAARGLLPSKPPTRPIWSSTLRIFNLYKADATLDHTRFRLLVWLAMPSDQFGKITMAAGQLRWLGLVSLLLAAWLSWQAQFVTVSSFVWLSFHHISAPITIVTTFLRRGTSVAWGALLVALAADALILLTSFVAVWRCAQPSQAAEDCPNRMLNNGWIGVYSLYQIIIGLFELLSLFSFESLLQKDLERWETSLEAAETPEAAKRLVDDAENAKAKRVAGVERRLSVFALPAGAAFWVFAAPFDFGWLALLAATRPLRDAVGIWTSYRAASGTRTQREFYETVTTVLSGLYLAVSLGAWMWAEELKLPIEDFSLSILLDAAKSAYDDPFSFMAAGSAVRPEPFLLTFAFLEVLVLCNKNTPAR